MSSAQRLGLIALALSLSLGCSTARSHVATDAGSTGTRDAAARDGAAPAIDAARDAFVAPGTDAYVAALDSGVDAAVAPTDAGRDAAVVAIDAGHDAATTSTCSGLDCTSCGSGSYCAHGVCGMNPTTLSYDFESGAIPGGWTNGAAGTTAWRMASSGAHGGTYAAESGLITDSGSTGLSFTLSLATAATISFWLHTDSESGFDYLHFFVDGAMQGEWSGTTAWTQVSYPLASGSHTFEWRYTKDGSVSVGADAAWIDDVTIASGGSVAEGFESAALPSGYTTSGTTGWVTDTTSPHTGTRSAASGVITDSETTSMTTSVTLSAASTLTFWYRVSSESTYDYLHVFIDGTMQGEWSGEVAWTAASYPLAAGAHTVEWRYTKDVSLSDGSDRAWVDDVDFHDTIVAGGPLCM